MARSEIVRPGQILFLAGVLLVILATGLGYYLASLRMPEAPHPDWHTPDYDRLENLRKLAESQVSLASNVHALMWMVFGLGTTLTLFGLRLMTRPTIEERSSKPIGPTRKVFENPE